MKPWKTLAQAQAPDGGLLALSDRDGEFIIRINGEVLMTSRRHGSEAAMAEAGMPHAAPSDGGRILVGGLGCGYTLRAALDRVGKQGRVTVVEFSAAVIDWNRGVLGALTDHPLRDPRVSIELDDIGRAIRRRKAAFDAILLDVDNGPHALTTAANGSLYRPSALAAAWRALRPGGRLVIWSVGPEPRFVGRLEAAGFLEARETMVRAHAGRARRGSRHTLFIARRPPAGASAPVHSVVKR